MKTKKLLPDIVPVFDRRDGGEAYSEELRFKTWSEWGGFRWNQYREYSLSLNSGLRPGETPETLMENFIRDIRAKGERVIAGAFHNFALSVIVTTYPQKP